MARRAPWLLSLALAGCASSLTVGEECTDSSECEVGSSCFFADAAMSRSVCMADCDDATTRLCDGGEVCIPASTMGVPREQEVCFLGGDVPVGSPCETTFDCTRGALCVILGTEQTCYRACSTDDGSACQRGETCEGLRGMGTRGYCAATP